MRINHAGSAGNAVVTALLAVLLVAALIFGGWSFSRMQDYKNNTDAKVASAVEAAKKTQAAELQSKFDQDYKLPNKTFTGSATYGSIAFSYPKTWSGYLDTSSNEPINGYFYPDIVPRADAATAYALRVELVNSTYNQTVHQYDSLITNGKLRSTAYIPPKMKGASNAQLGVRLDGALSQNNNATKSGSLVILQVRDKTLKIYAEAPNFIGDFNNTILATLTYAP